VQNTLEFGAGCWEVILVAEETGVVPAYPIGRTFRDRLVERLGTDLVYLVTGGHVPALSAPAPDACRITPLPPSWYLIGQEIISHLCIGKMARASWRSFNSRSFPGACGTEMSHNQPLRLGKATCAAIVEVECKRSASFESWRKKSLRESASKATPRRHNKLCQYSKQFCDPLLSAHIALPH